MQIPAKKKKLNNKKGALGKAKSDQKMKKKTGKKQPKKTGRKTKNDKVASPKKKTKTPEPVQWTPLNAKETAAT